MRVINKALLPPKLTSPRRNIAQLNESREGCSAVIGTNLLCGFDSDSARGLRRNVQRQKSPRKKRGLGSIG